MSIGSKIRALRILKGFTQEAFAERLGLSQNSYSKIELGKTRLNLERLQ